MTEPIKFERITELPESFDSSEIIDEYIRILSAIWGVPAELLHEDHGTSAVMKAMPIITNNLAVNEYIQRGLLWIQSQL